MKKNRELVIIVVLFVTISSVILTRELDNLDESWNFNFGINISNGNLPYKDFNMVPTPLSAFISGITLKIFGNELLVMRLLGALLCTAILYVVYIILDKLKVNKYLIYFSLILAFLLHLSFFTYDYNYLLLLITLLAIYFELDSNILRLNVKKDLILGILVGTSIIIKQTTGIILSLVFIFYKILIAKEKEEWKSVFKIVLFRILGVLVPVVLFLIFLIKNNIMYDFLNYAVYGIKEFSNYILYPALFKYYGIHIAILALVIPFAILYMYYRAIIKEEKSSIFVLFAYSCASITAVYPISDDIHFSIAIIPAFIGLIYILHELFKGKIKKKINKEILKSIIDIAIISVVVISTINLTKYIIGCRKYDSLNHFKYIPVRY